MSSVPKATGVGAWIGLSLALLLACASPMPEVQPALRVVAGTPTLASLAVTVGGDRITVVNLIDGPADPLVAPDQDAALGHLAGAHLFLRAGDVGDGGWSRALAEASDNPAIKAGQPGNFDASVGVPPAPGFEIAGLESRPSASDDGYLLDPVVALSVTRRLADRMIELRPADREAIDQAFADFENELLRKLVGDHIVDAVGLAEVAGSALGGPDQSDLLTAHEPDGGVAQGGWFGMMSPHHGMHMLADRNVWTYFGPRFGVSVLGQIEPEPGVSPTSSDVHDAVAESKRTSAKVLLTLPFLSGKSSRKVAAEADEVEVAAAHQVGAHPEIKDYVGLIAWNVDAISKGLAEAAQPAPAAADEKAP